MSRTNIELNDALVRKARKLTRLKTKRAIVDKALELLVRSESRKGILALLRKRDLEGRPETNAQESRLILVTLPFGSIFSALLPAAPAVNCGA